MIKKQLSLALFALLLAFSPAHAQTTPTANETQVGDPCTKASHSFDFDTLVQCTSTDATAGTLQKAPLFVGAVTAPPYTATTCDANKKGMIQYDGTDMQFCDGTAWQTLPTKAYVDAAGGETRNSQTFTSSGTWTRPDGVSSVDILVVGGGGGAAGCVASTRDSTGGGGGGDIVWAPNMPISEDLTITIGAAGSGGTPTGETNGGNSSAIGATSASIYAIAYGGIASTTSGFGGAGSGGKCRGGKKGNYTTATTNYTDWGEDGLSCIGGGGGGGRTGYYRYDSKYGAGNGGNGGNSLFSLFGTGSPGLGHEGKEPTDANIAYLAYGSGGGGASFSGQAGHGGASYANGGNATGYGGGGGGCQSPSYDNEARSGGNGAPGVAILYWNE